MFSLIISIIAIALVASLALASIYYGGDAFQEGTTAAQASTILNQAQQTQGAIVLSNIDNLNAKTMAELVPNYLKEIPQFEATPWTFEGHAELYQANAIILDLGTTDVELCTEVQEQAADTTTIESVADVASLTSKQSQGCFQDSDDSDKYKAFFVI